MNIFISANNTNQGKTFATFKLIQQFSKMGYRVGVFKPIETGVEEYPKDGALLFNEAKKHNPKLNELSLEDIVPIQHRLAASPYVSGDVDFDKIKKAFEKVKAKSDIVLIEGAGGLLVPIKDDFLMLNFLNFFDAKLFLVIGSQLGMINDFLLNKYFLECHHIPFDWAINLFDQEEYFRITHPYMQQYNPLFLQNDLDKIAQKLLGE